MRIYDYLTGTRDTMNAYRRMCEPVLRQYDVPQVSFDILMFLANNPECSTAQEISEIRGIKKNLVSVHVEKLVQAGLLQRGSISGDRRKIALAVTEKAMPIIQAGLSMQQAFFERITGGITAADWTAYKRVNAQVTENVRRILKTND